MPEYLYFSLLILHESIVILKSKVWDREKIVILPEHYIFTNDERANRNVDILRDFCTEQNIKYFYDIKDRSDFKVYATLVFHVLSSNDILN